MTRKDINDIICLMNSNDSRCQGAAQQVANGFYRCVDLLGVLIRFLDKDGTSSSEVDSIERTFNSNEMLCQSAPQQSANGAYRVVELLGVLINVLDSSASARVDAVIHTMNKNETYSQSAPQQIANGSYRIAEMLQILAGVYDSSLVSSADGIIATMNRMEALCQSAPQQSSNGTDASSSLVELIAKKMDKDAKYNSKISSIVRLRESNNSRCQGADQQSGNYLYRTLELAQVITDILMDAEDEKIAKKREEYWLAHPEERANLLKEREELQEKIKEIKKRADAINNDEALNALNRELQSLNSKLDNVPTTEVDKAEAAINAKKAERDALGIFKFSQRKAINLEIDGLIVKKAEEEAKVAQAKAAIQKDIDACKAKIEKIKADVQKQKDAVLAEKAPYDRKVKHINDELTRPR